VPKLATDLVGDARILAVQFVPVEVQREPTVVSEETIANVPVVQCLRRGVELVTIDFEGEQMLGRGEVNDGEKTAVRVAHDVLDLEPWQSRLSKEGLHTGVQNASRDDFANAGIKQTTDLADASTPLAGYRDHGITNTSIGDELHSSGTVERSLNRRKCRNRPKIDECSCNGRHPNAVHDGDPTLVQVRQPMDRHALELWRAKPRGRDLDRRLLVAQHVMHGRRRSMRRRGFGSDR